MARRDVVGMTLPYTVGAAAMIATTEGIVARTGPARADVLQRRRWPLSFV